MTARQFQQVPGVIGSSHAAGKYSVVASRFALLAELPHCQPDHWMEPVEAACGLGGNLGNKVVPLHMDKFMQHDGVQPRSRPAARRFGQQHNRAQRAPSHGHCRTVAFQRAHRTADRKVAAQSICQCLGIRRGPRRSHHADRADRPRQKSPRHNQ